MMVDWSYVTFICECTDCEIHVKPKGNIMASNVRIWLELGTACDIVDKNRDSIVCYITMSDGLVLYVS
jgi:hypothetical protein